MLFNKQNLLNLNQNVASLATPVSIRVKALPSRGDFDTYLSSADTEGGNASFDRRIGGFTNLPVTESSDNRLLRYRNSMKVGWENYESEIQGTESTAIFKGLLQYHPTDDIFSYVGNRPFNVQRATLTLTTKNKKPVTGTFQVEYMKNDPVISESATWESPSPETGARWFSPTVAAGSSAALTTSFPPGVHFSVEEDEKLTYDFSQPQMLLGNGCVIPGPNPGHPDFQPGLDSPDFGPCSEGTFFGQPYYLRPGCNPCAAGIPGFDGCVGGPKRVPLRPPPVYELDENGEGKKIEPYAWDPVTGCEYYNWEGSIWERCPGRNPVWRIGNPPVTVNTEPDIMPPPGNIVYPPPPDTLPPGGNEPPSFVLTNALGGSSVGKLVTWSDYIPCFGIPLCPDTFTIDDGSGDGGGGGGGGGAGNNPGGGNCDKLSGSPYFRCDEPYNDAGCRRCTVKVPGKYARPRGIKLTPEQEWDNIGHSSDEYNRDFCQPNSNPCIPIGGKVRGPDDEEPRPRLIIANPGDWKVGDSVERDNCRIVKLPAPEEFAICCELPGQNQPEICAIYARPIRQGNGAIVNDDGTVVILDDDDCGECRPEGGCKSDPPPYDEDFPPVDGPSILPFPQRLDEDTSPDDGTGGEDSPPGTGFDQFGFGLNTGTTDSRGYYSSLLSTTTVKNSSTVQFDITKLMAQWATDPNKPLSFTVRYPENNYVSETFEFNTMEASVLPIGDGVYTTCRFLTGGETTDIKTAGIRSILEQTDNGVKITVVENDLTSQTAFNSFASLVGTGETFAFVDPDTNNNINIGAATCTMLSRPSNNSIIVAGISLPNGVESHETTVDMSATSVEIPAGVYILDINTPTKKTLNAFAALSAGDAISVNYSAASTTNNAKEFTIKSVSDETLFHNRLRVYLNESVVSEDRRNKPTQIDEAGIRPSLSIDLLIE